MVAIVVPGAQETGTHHSLCIDRLWLSEPELREIERSVLVGRALEPNEVVEHLCHTESREPRARVVVQ